MGARPSGPPARLLLAGAALSGVLGGCAGPVPQAPVEERALSGPPAETEPGRAPFEARPDASESPAVIALLGAAGRARAQGQHAGAVANIERALRIEPRNPRLWQALAEVKLDQGKPREAESLADRALALSGDPASVRRSWRLIAEARRQRGDAPGARQAEAEAARARP